MSLFNFKKVKKKLENENDLGAMLIFSTKQGCQTDALIEHLSSFWDLSVTSIENNNKGISFLINNHLVNLYHIEKPISSEEFDQAISRTYVWRNAAEGLCKQASHTIISVNNDMTNTVENHLILSQLICSVMLTTDSCFAVYQPKQNLILQKEHYLTAVDDIRNGRLPIPAWIYIGMENAQGLSSMYTHGMVDFGKPEVEIIASIFNLNHLYKLMLSFTSDIIEKDLSFKSGDVYQITENISLKVALSDGVHVACKTLKLEV